MQRKPTVFVTGASQGMGAALALRMARDGYDVAVSGTKAANLADTAGRLRDTGARVVAVALDLRQQANLEHAMAEVHGVLVFEPLEEMPDRRACLA